MALAAFFLPSIALHLLIAALSRGVLLETVKAGLVSPLLRRRYGYVPAPRRLSLGSRGRLGV